MFESTLEAQGLHDSERRLGTLSAAVLAHLGIGLAIVAVTATIVPPVHPPDAPSRVIVIVPGISLDEVSPRPVLPRPKKGTDAATPGKAIAIPRVHPESVPTAPPESLPPTASEDAPSAFDGPGDGTQGVPNGSLFGVPGGPGTEDAPSGEATGLAPVYVTGDMVRPVLLVKVEPSYPEAARLARLSGRVTVRAVIAPDGNVESVEVLASTNALFNDAAIDAVRRWRYRPALMNGVPVRVYFSVVVQFLLH